MLHIQYIMDLLVNVSSYRFEWKWSRDQRWGPSFMLHWAPETFIYVSEGEERGEFKRRGEYMEMRDSSDSSRETAVTAAETAVTGDQRQQ